MHYDQQLMPFNIFLVCRMDQSQQKWNVEREGLKVAANLRLGELKFAAEHQLHNTGTHATKNYVIMKAADNQYDAFANRWAEWGAFPFEQCIL